MVVQLELVAVLATICALAYGKPFHPRAATPTLKSATEVGYVASYPTLNRDSMTGTPVGDGYFWTSRDATNFDGQGCFISEKAFIHLWEQTADIPHSRKCRLMDELGLGWLASTFQRQLDNIRRQSCHLVFPNILRPVTPEWLRTTSPNRWIDWPDTPPMPVDAGNGQVKLYT